MIFSLNNRLIVEEYVKEGLKATVMGGIATPGQRDGIKKLKILVGTKLSDGRDVPEGSYAFIREEVLHVHQWASKPLTCSGIPGRFLIVELPYVEFIEAVNPKLNPGEEFYP